MVISAASCEDYFIENPSANVATFDLDGGDRKERASFACVREDDRIRGKDVNTHEYLEALAIRFDMILLARCGHCLDCEEEDLEEEFIVR